MSQNCHCNLVSRFVLTKVLKVAYGGHSRSLFNVHIYLTQKGEENMVEVLGIVFKYIDLLKNDGGINEVMFEELRLIDEMQFNYQDRSKPFSYVRSTSQALHIYDKADILRGGLLQVRTPQRHFI